MASPGNARGRSASTDGGAPTSFGPSTTSERVGIPASTLDGEDVVPPRGARRWWPDEKALPPSEEVRQETLSLISRKPNVRSIYNWQMNFPFDLPSGRSNPVCALGECGDPSCPLYRPKHPEVREAVERTIVEKSVSHFTGSTELYTYASVGSGLLAQDWLILERLRQHNRLPRRAIFVDTKSARPLIQCEGCKFPRPTSNGGMNLRQTGFNSPLGPEFSFCADIEFDEQTRPSVLFDFCNGPGDDAIFVEVGGPDHPGLLVFGVSCGTDCQSLQIQDCWKAGSEAHTYLFTVSATGVLRVYVDQAMISMGVAQAPKAIVRKHLHLGQSSLPDSSFKGKISRVKIWGEEVDTQAPGSVFESETELALKQFAQWFADEMSVWSFGSLASYAAAAEKDPRFAADLLVKVDVHEDLEGYDDFCCQALSKNGMSLTMGGPGRSWCRSGGGWCLVTTNCAVLDAAEEKAKAPWANNSCFGSDNSFCALADLSKGLAWCRSRRLRGRRRPQLHTQREQGEKATRSVRGHAGKPPQKEPSSSSGEDEDQAGRYGYDRRPDPRIKRPSQPRQVRCSPDLSQWERYSRRTDQACDRSQRSQNEFGWQRKGDDFEWERKVDGSDGMEWKDDLIDQIWKAPRKAKPDAKPKDRRVSFGQEQVLSPARSSGESAAEEPPPVEQPLRRERLKPSFCRGPSCRAPRRGFLPCKGLCMCPGAGGQPPAADRQREARGDERRERSIPAEDPLEDDIPTLDDLLADLDVPSDDSG